MLTRNHVRWLQIPFHSPALADVRNVAELMRFHLSQG